MPWRGEVGGLGVQAQSAASWLACTPQHCRSSEPLPSFYAESWSGFDQAQSSMAMGSSSCGGGGGDDDDAEMASFPLSDYQPETWWPPINVQINLQSTVHQNILNVDRKPALTVTPSTGQTSYSNIEFPPPLIPETPVPRLEVWCPEPPAPSTAATTTSEPPPPSSALAAVNTAIAEVAAAITPSLPSLPSSPAAPAPPSGSSRVPKVVRGKGKCASAPASPTKDASLAVQKASSGNKRPLTQRQNHIWSERQRRKGMNFLFESLRSLLPQPSPTNKTDKSTVVGEIIKYIQTLQVQLEVLTKKQQQVVAARALGANATAADTTNPVVAVPIAAPRRGVFAGAGGGVTVVDHSGEAGSATAVTVVPPVGRESCLQSYVGANVGVHVCGLNVFITTSSPRGRRGLLHQLLLTLHRHALDVINATISSTNASVFHCLHCQASRDAELLNNDLHHALQSVINQFG